MITDSLWATAGCGVNAVHYAGGVATLILLRHGRTTANASGVLAGWSPDVHLDAVGVTQAAEVAARILEATRPVRLVASPLTRCQETAAPLAAAARLQIESCDDLGECHYGAWTGRSLTDLAAQPLWTDIQQRPSSVTFPPSEQFAHESIPAMQARAVSAADFEQGVRRWWWRPLAVLQWIALAALLVGLGWLGLWWFGEYLRLSLPEPPGWPGESALSRVPIPSVLAIGGILASVLLSLLGTACSRLSARRHARRLHDQLLRGCREVAETRVGDPMRAVLERHAVYCEHLASARREREVRKGRSAGPR